jgi:hypothetical protein
MKYAVREESSEETILTYWEKGGSNLHNAHLLLLVWIGPQDECG